MQIRNESFQKNPQSPRRIRHLLPAPSSRKPHTHELNPRTLPICVVSTVSPRATRGYADDSLRFTTERAPLACEIPFRAILSPYRARFRSSTGCFAPSESIRSSRVRSFVRSDRSFVRSRRRRGYVPSSSGGMEGGVDVAPGSEGGAAGPNCVDARHLHLGPFTFGGYIALCVCFIRYRWKFGHLDAGARARVRTDGWIRSSRARRRDDIVSSWSFSSLSLCAI